MNVIKKFSKYKELYISTIIKCLKQDLGYDGRGKTITLTDNSEVEIRQLYLYDNTVRVMVYDARKADYYSVPIEDVAIESLEELAHHCLPNVRIDVLDALEKALRELCYQMPEDQKYIPHEAIVYTEEGEIRKLIGIEPQWLQEDPEGGGDVYGFLKFEDSHAYISCLTTQSALDLLSSLV